MNVNKWLCAAITTTSLFLTPYFAQAEQYPQQAEDMSEALESFYSGDWDESIRLFEAVSARDPQNTLALAYVLDAYYRKKDVDGIVSQIETETASAGETGESLSRLGMAYFLRGKLLANVLDEALTEFRSAIENDPENSMAYTGMGLVYFQKRMMPRAKGFFVRALRQNPHDVMAMDRLGNILLVDEKKPAEAKEIYQRIIEELPTYPDGHYFMGSALYDLGQTEEAIPYLKRCAELDPHGYTQGFDALTLCGDIYLKDGKFEEALAIYEEAKKVRPDSTYVDYKMKLAKEKKTSPATKVNDD
ncbi:tetratricopeptide repeat protein [bacterium]|nr:tetratricopeptide repeat protein [bacterium]